MFSSVGGGEVLVLLLLVLFVFGPERLPELTQSAATALRQARRYLTGITADLKGELGPELGGLDFDALRDPKAFVLRQLWEDEPDTAGAPNTRPGAGVALSADEVPPWDPDTT